MARLERLAPGQAMVRLVTEAGCRVDEGRAGAAEARLKQIALLDPRHDALQALQLRAQQMLQNPSGT